MGKNSGLPADLSRFRVATNAAFNTPALNTGVSNTGAAAQPSGPLGRPDDAGCGVLHVDMDAFYAAVELRTRPELKTRPVVIAGAGPRSVVVSANYVAREWGIRSAMPTSIARRRCPHAVYLPPTHGLYGEVSRGVMAIFREITPLVEPLSLDEAFLDVRGALKRLGSTPIEIGAVIRKQVEEQHGITCSVGIASVKFVAKLASGLAKPDGMVVVPQHQIVEFLHPLPVSSLWGVGKRTEEQLHRMGLRLIGDVAATSLNTLQRKLGNAVGAHLHALSHGIDERAVVPDSPDKSVGAEHTFGVDQDDREVLNRELLSLAEKVAAILRSRKLRGKTISIKVRFSGFHTITRARSQSTFTDTARDIYAVARALFDEAAAGRSIRLIGVRVEGLISAAEPEQLSFEVATQAQPRWRDAEVAADNARSKFGGMAVQPASLLSRTRPESTE